MKCLIPFIALAAASCATINPYPDVENQYAKDVCSERDNFKACMRERQAELDQIYCDKHPSMPSHLSQRKLLAKRCDAQGDAVSRFKPKGWRGDEPHRRGEFYCDDHPEDRRHCDMDYRDRKGLLQ